MKSVVEETKEPEKEKEEKIVIGSLKLHEQIETVDHNSKKYLNVKKFEDQCKKHSLEEKTDLTLEWCMKMIKVWQS